MRERGKGKGSEGGGKGGREGGRGGRERERDIYIYICCKVSNWATFGPF